MEKQTSYTYWIEVSKLKDLHEKPKFSLLAKMTTTWFCLSHGNAEPERGFSENKNVLKDRESMHEETIVAIRMTKDFISFYDNVTKIPITRRLLTFCQNARNKYQCFLDDQKKRKRKY